MLTAEGWVRATAWVSGALYALTLAGWLLHRRRRRPGLRSLRLSWTLSWLIFLVHVALAFHVFHHWSHQDAWGHTQRLSGYGDGVYFNYAVMMIWTSDVAWWWFGARSYVTRPRWVTGLVHGFLFFMWLNAAVVFPVMNLLK